MILLHLRPRKIAPSIIGIRVSVSSIACTPAVHTTCNYSYTFIMLVDIIISYRGRDGTDARRTQYIFKASKLAIITKYSWLYSSTTAL